MRLKQQLLPKIHPNILAYSPVYVQDHGMVITNNSYGVITDDCNTFGVYDLVSRIMDLQTFQMPNLQHVFAAGNSGQLHLSLLMWQGLAMCWAVIKLLKTRLALAMSMNWALCFLIQAKGR